MTRDIGYSWKEVYRTMDARISIEPEEIVDERETASAGHAIGLDDLVRTAALVGILCGMLTCQFCGTTTYRVLVRDRSGKQECYHTAHLNGETR